MTKPVMIGTQYKGVIPPLVLPLRERSGIDFSGLERQVRYLLAGGISGLWVNGTSGDFFALSAEERSSVIRACVEIVENRVPVIAQVGDCATRRVIDHAHRAMEAGAQAISVVPPFYLDYSQPELIRHYTILGREIPLPLFLYQVPQMSRTALSLENVLRLAEEGVLTGIKDSTGDVTWYSRLLREVQRRQLSLRCFYGASTLCDVGLYAGGHGIMCAVANLAPHLCSEVYQAAERSDWTQAKKINARILRLIDSMELPERSNWASTIAIYKWLLFRLGILSSARVYRPLSGLTDLEKQLLEERCLPQLQALITQTSDRLKKNDENYKSPPQGSTDQV